MLTVLLEKDVINQGDGARPEDECVSLEVADLEEAQHQPEAVSAAGEKPPDDSPVEHPAVKPRHVASQQILRPRDQKRVDFVDVKFVRQHLDEVFLLFVLVVGISQSRARHEDENRQACHQMKNVVFIWKFQEMTGEKAVPGEYR